MRSDTKDWLLIIGGIAAVLLVITGIIYAAVLDQERKDACERRGGRVVKVNCRTEMQCNTYQYSKSHSSTTCTPVEHCDWECQGLQAEAAP